MPCHASKGIYRHDEYRLNTVLKHAPNDFIFDTKRRVSDDVITMPEVTLDKVIKAVSYGVLLGLKGLYKEAIGRVIRT
jgi:hypothetical protein